MNQTQGSGATFGLVGVVILAIMAGMILIGAIQGARRGFVRQAVRTLTVLISFVISLFAVTIVQNIFDGWLASQSGESFAALVEGYGFQLGDLRTIIEALAPLTIEYILAIPLYLIVVPVTFIVIFILANVIMAILHIIVCRILGFRKFSDKNFLSRLTGFALGAFQGVLTAVICLSPFTGLAASITTAVNEMPDGTAKDKVVRVYDQYVKSFAEDRSVALLNKLGGEWVYEIVSTAIINNTSHNMAEEVVNPSLKLASAATDLAEINWQNMSEKDKEVLDTLVDVAEESPYAATILADILDALAVSYKQGTAGVESNGLAKTLIEEILTVFEGIDSEELPETLAVIRDVLFMLSDDGAIATLGDTNADLNKISDILSKKDAGGKTLVDRVTSKLKENNRTAGIVSTLTKISITAMSQNMSGLGGIEVNEETYENVKDGLSDVVNIKKDEYETEEEYVGAISDSLNSTLVDNGIELDKSLVDDMAQHVADNFGDKEDLSDEEIDSIILSYYSAYLESQSSGTTPDIPGLPDLPNIPDLPNTPEIPGQE